jgi:hypothetical protein
VLTEAGTCLATRGLASKDSPSEGDRTGGRTTRVISGTSGSGI